METAFPWQKKGNWIKVKIKDDGYSGFIKKKNFANFINQHIRFVF